MSSATTAAFGTLLRHYRHAAGLTQQELAERAGLASRAISDLERGARNRPYRDTVIRLADALGVPEPVRSELFAAARRVVSMSQTDPRADVSEPIRFVRELPRSSGSEISHNLPVPLSSFVGRERELDELKRCLESSRLLTLTGPPGVGKTRLALTVAARQSAAFVDGVRFLSVVATRDPDLLLSAIAQSVGVEGTERQPLLPLMATALRERRILLLLDNFEQVVAAGPLLSELLEACPRLTALVTSRTRLRVRGEREFVVPPLTLPDIEVPRTGGGGAVSRVLRSEAARLFVERAREDCADFAVTGENAPIIAEICRRLDGSPLAIELAAAWVRTLDPASLLARLADRLTLLTAGSADRPRRQQTWREAIAWSFGLLGPDAQVLFRRLAVFSGGFTFQAAETIAQATLPALASLLDASLVLRVNGAASDAEPRFGMLETIRDYADERLAESGEADSLRRRHATYFLAFAEAAKAAFNGPRERVELDRLERDHDNLQAALRFLLDEADAEHAVRLGNVLEWLWTIRGYVDEARRSLVRLLELARAAGRVKDQADVLRLSGRMALKQSDYAIAWARLEESLALARQVGDRHGVAESLAFLGIIARVRGDYALARAQSQESLEIYRELGDAWGVGAQLDRVGMAAFYEGDAATACALVEESLVVRQQIGDQTFTAYALTLLGELAHARGEHAAARSSYEQSLAIFRDQGYREGMCQVLPCFGDLALDEGDLAGGRVLLAEALVVGRAQGSPSTMIEALEGLAGLAAAQKDAERCLRLAGAVSAFREAIGAECTPDRRARIARRLAPARASLGEEAGAIAWAKGRAMTLEQAVAYALEEASR